MLRLHPKASSKTGATNPQSCGAGGFAVRGALRCLRRHPIGACPRGAFDEITEHGNL
jgi:hypothetical protein